MLSHQSMAEIYSMKAFGKLDTGHYNAKAFDYLNELERSGYVCGWLYKAIADHYCYHMYPNSHMARRYCRLAINKGFDYAYVSLYDMKRACEYEKVKTATNKLSTAMLRLLSEDKASVKDDRVFDDMVKDLSKPSHIMSGRIHYDLGPFESSQAMAMYFCDALIQRGSALGYFRKICLYGMQNFDSKQKEVEVMEEADRAELATYDMYGWLLHRYMYGNLIHMYTTTSICNTRTSS